MEREREREREKEKEKKRHWKKRDHFVSINGDVKTIANVTSNTHWEIYGKRKDSSKKKKKKCPKNFFSDFSR